MVSQTAKSGAFIVAAKIEVGAGARNNRRGNTPRCNKRFELCVHVDIMQLMFIHLITRRPELKIEAQMSTNLCKPSDGRDVRQILAEFVNKSRPIREQLFRYHQPVLRFATAQALFRQSHLQT